MNELISLIKNAAKEIESFNKEFGYTAGKSEIAADVWYNHTTLEQRILVMNETRKDGQSVNQHQKECFNFIGALI